MKSCHDHNTEEEILEVAEKLFLEKGFAMTSTTEIAKEVGCNQALVHYYYRSKEKLFAAIFEKKISLFLSALMRISDENLSFEEKLKIKIESHFDMLKANPQIPFLLFNELITNSKRLSSLKETLSILPKEAIEKIQIELQSEINKGKIRPMSVADLVITIVSLNVMLFVTQPIIEHIFSFSEEEYKQFVEHRKKENVRIIMTSLKP